MAEEKPDELLVANVGQKVILEKDGKVLMCRGKVTYHDLDKLWDFPGGRMHTNEQPIPALKRELEEELGVEFEIHEPLGACVTYDTPSGVPRYYVVFRATLSNPSAEFTVADDELSELRWIDASEVESLHTWEDWRVLLRKYFSQSHAS